MYGILLFLKYDTTYICMFQQYIYVMCIYIEQEKYVNIFAWYVNMLCINGIYFYVKICYVSALYSAVYIMQIFVIISIS